MTHALSFTVHGESWVHRIDPRVKLLFSASAILVMLLVKNAALLGMALLLMMLAHLSARIAFERIAAIVKALLPVSLLMFVLRVAFYPEGEAFRQLGPLQITVGAAAQGAALAFRILAMGYAVMLWLYTTEEGDLMRSLVKLKLPYSLALSLTLALRFIPTISDSYSAIADAYQARGLDLSSEKGLSWLRARIPIFSAMIIAAFRMSEDLARSLEARAYGATGVQRTSLRELRFNRLDILLLASILLGLAGSLYLNLALGWGSSAIMLMPGR